MRSFEILVMLPFVHSHSMPCSNASELYMMTLNYQSASEQYIRDQISTKTFDISCGDRCLADVMTTPISNNPILPSCLNGVQCMIPFNTVTRRRLEMSGSDSKYAPCASFKDKTCSSVHALLEAHSCDDIDTCNTCCLSDNNFGDWWTAVTISTILIGCFMCICTAIIAYIFGGKRRVKTEPNGKPIYDNTHRTTVIRYNKSRI